MRFTPSAILFALFLPAVASAQELPPPEPLPQDQTPLEPREPLEPTYVEGQLIVRFEEPTTMADAIERLADLPFVVDRPLMPQLDMYLVLIADDASVPAAAARLQALPQVRYAVPDHHVERRQTFPNDPSFSQQWGMYNTGQSGGQPGADISAPMAWSLGTGSGDYVIAIVDGGGRHQHPDLIANRWVNQAEANGLPGVDDDGNGYVDDIYGWNAYSNNGNIPNDTHGTHVAGIAGAVGNNSTGVVGVNWNTKLMYVAGASGSTSVVLTAYNYVLNQRNLWVSSGGTAGANVVAANSSFGIDFANCNSGQYQPWNDAYNAMGNAGILNAAATINSHVNVDNAGDVPTGCSSQWLISVTNTTRTDAKNSSAGFGPNTIDLGAPGTDIRSTVPNTGYSNFTGTSMATPHVTGAVAFLHSVASPSFKAFYASNPAAAALELKNIMLDNVDVIPSLSSITVSGGRLNLHAAGVAINNWGDTTSIYCVAAPHSGGLGASIGSSGNTSIGANAFVLSVTEAKPATMGLFIYGSTQVQVAFGNGFRCVGGTTARLNPFTNSDSFGDNERWVDFTQGPPSSGQSQIHPGSSWNFQYWYRDPGTGAGFNLSNALAAAFTP